VHDLEVQEGDLLPAFYRDPNWIAERIRVTRIISANKVELQVDPARFSVQLPGDRSRHLTYFEVARAPVSIFMKTNADAAPRRAEVLVPR
jgi:hypothetical protein